jgi:hypothetical protein
MTASVKRGGTSGQISLGKEFAGRTVRIKSTEPGVWLIRTARTIPDAELWLHQPEAANRLALQKNEAWVALKTMRLLQTMDWQQLVLSKGLRWELIQNRQSPQGQRLFSLRVSRSCRAVAWRDGDWLRLLSLHPDHDSAYC